MSLLETTTPSSVSTGEAFAPRPKRWTVEEYDQAVAAGVFAGMRVQLIAGEIIEMAPMGTSHASALCLVQAALTAIFPAASYTVRNQCPLKLTESEPQPDAAVVAGAVRSIKTHPTTALLIVEIADSSIVIDQVSKLADYARAAVAEYWILNLPQRQLEVYRNPQPDGTYAPPIILTPGQSASPLAMPTASVAVNDLLP